MTAVSVVLFILGALLTIAGVVFVFLGRFADPPDKDKDELTVADLLERLDSVLEKVEKRYRWGIVMLGLGVALIAAGAWLAALGAVNMLPPPPGG